MHTNFKVIDLTQLGIKPEFTASESDALTTPPSELFEICLRKFTKDGLATSGYFIVFTDCEYLLGMLVPNDGFSIEDRVLAAAVGSVSAASVVAESSDPKTSKILNC